MSKQERSLPMIIRQAVEEKKLKEEEVPKEAKELFVKYYNLLARRGKEKTTVEVVDYGISREVVWWELPEVEIMGDGEEFKIQVFTEKGAKLVKEYFRLPGKITGKITNIRELEYKGPEQIVVSIRQKDNKLIEELVLNKEGKISGLPRTFLSFTVPHYTELCGFLEKRLSKRS